MAMESNPRENVVTKLCDSVSLPRMVKVRQKFDEDHLTPEEIPGVVRRALSRPEIKNRIAEGMSVAITCGSRGVANIAIITRAIVDFVKECGAIPFVFPAMGSHGGATAEGQRAIIEGYGVTEEFIGCPIRATMETVQIGMLEDGMPVYMDKYAHEADAVILSGRIKAHTAFRGPHESGIMKMSVIGMGKQRGAETVHESGFINMGKLMPRVAKVVLDHANVVAGVGMIENAFDETYKITALTKDEIWTEEPKLLLEAKRKMGRIWFDEIDELIVDRVGKDISGDGMDPNVTGRFACADSAGGGIRTKRIVVLDLTDETHGNANGIGMADITTRRALEKTDIDATYPNAVTSTVFDVVKMPLAANSDKTAIQLGLRSCNGTDKTKPYIVRIRDTMHLKEIYISEAMLEEAKKNPNIEIIGAPEEWHFHEDGNLW